MTSVDPRFTVVTHPQNLGPTRTFNLMYLGGGSDRYLSLLEDDNWWEPDFLAAMVSAMDAHPSIQVGWSNMRIWQELSDGSWKDTDRLVWNLFDYHLPRLIDWPHPRQPRGGIHSNGAMLIRADAAARFRIPNDTPFAAIECVRERLFHYPLLFLPAPLAELRHHPDDIPWGR